MYSCLQPNVLHYLLRGFEFTFSEKNDSVSEKISAEMKNSSSREPIKLALIKNESISDPLFTIRAQRIRPLSEH